MEYIITLLLGIILGVLIFYIIKPSTFVDSPKLDFNAMESMFEEFMTELDQKQEAFRQEMDAREAAIREIQREIEARFSEALISPKVLKVQQLAESGYQTEEIAKKLALGKGEVELILGLQKATES